MKNQQQSRRSRSRVPSTHDSKIQPVKEIAGRWANLLTSQNFTELDEMTRLAPGSGSIGGGNSQVQELLKQGIRRGKTYAADDGTAFVAFENGGKVVGCAYLQVSGSYITEAKIMKF